ncbi:MAG: tetratricopeptide repeat protein [Alphaproteobacteria bacterium]
MMKRVILCIGLLALLPVLGVFLAPATAQEAPNDDKLGLVSYWLDRGNMALESDALDQARMAYERAMLADPRQSATHANLGRAHLAMGNGTAAAKYLRTALDIDPQNLDALHWAGLVDLLGDDVEAAKKRRDKLLTLCSSNCQQYRALSKAVKNYADAKLEEEAAALSASSDK